MINQYFKPPQIQWRLMTFHCAWDIRDFTRTLAEQTGDTMDDMGLEINDVSISEVNPETGELLNIDQDFRAHEMDFRLARRWKVSTRGFFNASLEWLFLRNEPTRLSVPYFLQWIGLNDVMRLCPRFPLMKMTCKKDCRICVSRNSTIGNILILVKKYFESV